MEIININETNIDSEHICCAIGNDKVNQRRANEKKEWLKARFKDGLVFKRLNERWKIFIEYMPIEKVWKPVIWKKYMFINCLWVSWKFKWQWIWLKLLNACIEDSKKKWMDWIAVISSSKVKPFLTDKKFYEKHGFTSIERIDPYFELLELKFNTKAISPTFNKDNITQWYILKKWFTFIFSNQCPFMEEYVWLLSDILNKRAISFKVKKLESYKEAQELWSPFWTLWIYYNWVFLNHELMSEKKFEKLLDSL